MTAPYWTKVEWSAFVKHFRKMTDAEIAKDIRESMDDLEEKNSKSGTFGAYMVQSSMERIAKNSATRAAAGKQGASTRWNQFQATQPQPTAKQVAPVGKNTYGEFANVFLTTEEYLRLQSDFQEALDYVERLSAYLANNPSKAYANHYAAIRKWIAEDRQKAKEAEANRPKSFKEQERDRIRLLFADDEAVKRYKGEA